MSNEAVPLQPNKKLRVFFNSNAPFSTSGYGNQMADLLPRVHKAGYPTAICDFFGLEGGKLIIDGVIHYPKINHVFGSDALVHHAHDFNADVSITLQDVQMLHPQDLQRAKRWIPYIPVDHDPIPNIVFDRLHFAYRVITMSEFGQNELKRKGVMSTLIPHSVDTSIFYPMDKTEARRQFGFTSDMYIVGMVAANKDNPPRKSFQEAMDAFKMFLEKEKNAYLYIHTNPEFPGGFPIREYANFLGIGDRVLFPDVYQLNFNYTKYTMNYLYNSFDVLLLPSRSEGFGVPAIEAQACGIPVIVNRFTSMPEMIIEKKTGFVCEVASKIYGGMGSYYAVPDTLSLHNKMIDVWKADRTAMQKAAREWILSKYDLNLIWETKWIPFLEKLENEIYTNNDTEQGK
jgi:glycosyltransferase involved in cell wall biosynthesis